jgi:hypothetical protein
MIPKSGNRFSDQIVLNQKIGDESDSTQSNQSQAAAQSIFMVWSEKSTVTVMRPSFSRHFCNV